MKNMQGRILALVLALILAGGAALAMPVRLSGATTIQASTTGGKAVELSLEAFQLLGTTTDKDYLIFTDGSYYVVKPDALGDVLATLPSDAVAALPKAGDLWSLSRGDKGGAVRKLQQALADLGYLDGGVDGDFGGGTERAVMAFQEAVGISQNGVANERLQMLALSMAQSGQSAGGSGEGGGIVGAMMQMLGSGETGAASGDDGAGASGGPVSLLDALAARTEANLQPIRDAGLALNYDDMTGKGFFTDGSTMTFDVSGSGDIDQYRLTVQFGFAVREGKDGAVTVNPAMQLACLCVRRPIMTNVIVKSGDFKGNANVGELTATLDGVSSVESGLCTLNDAMVQALANAADSGELKLRVTGRYNTFDVQVRDADLDGAAKIGQIALAMTAQPEEEAEAEAAEPKKAD